ncbi:MAG: hypothetical protein LC650_01585 [Actinobacteria bacterium]|nr:hypothetical protein [Actinomycetota bacterium]
MIVAFDPGGTTGVAELHVDYRIVSYNIEGEVTELWYLLDSLMPETVVYERFDYRPHQPNADLTPVELIGVIKLYGVLNQIQLVPQTQLKGHRGFWTDDKLKALDLYNTGEKGHSNDAVRQLLYYVTFELGDNTFVERMG